MPRPYLLLALYAHNNDTGETVRGLIVLETEHGQRVAWEDVGHSDQRGAVERIAARMRLTVEAFALGPALEVRPAAFRNYRKTVMLGRPPQAKERRAG